MQVNYAELIRCLRDCWDASTGPTCDCDHCLFRDKIVDDVGYTDYTKCETAMVLAAAAAIEELTAELEYTKRQYDLAVEDLEKIGWGEWIPVTERLPEENGEFLVCGRWRGKPIKIWVCERVKLGPIMGWANPAENPVISHWMPLPKTPKEERA